MIKLTYTNQPLCIPDLLTMLKSRGLVINDEAKAARQLEIISYFRLASYMRPMESDKSTHTYKPHSTFENAVDLYYFDKSLRAEIFTAIQSIEIAFRAALIDKVSAKYGAFWFADRSLFVDQVIYSKCLSGILKEINRSKEDFITEHLDKYDTPQYPPVWKTLEVLSFGSLTNLYCNLANITIKKEIARGFGLPQHEFLESWIRCMSNLRNYCAHHNRIWNRRFPYKPKLPKKLLTAPWVSPTGLAPYWLYSQLCCLIYLERIIHPDTTLAQRLKVLIYNHPNVDVSAMGFPKGWENEPLF